MVITAYITWISKNCRYDVYVTADGVQDILMYQTLLVNGFCQLDVR